MTMMAESAITRLQLAGTGISATCEPERGAAREDARRPRREAGRERASDAPANRLGQPCGPSDQANPGGRIVAGNRAVVYQGPGKVSVESVDYPELVLKPGPGVPAANESRKCPHGVILKVVASNIRGSDQHLVRGRTTAPVGLILGHEITGDAGERDPDVEKLPFADIGAV